MQILNQFVSRLKNKRNNFNNSISKLKKTKKILSSNAFKSYQNQIVFSIFLNFYIVQNARNNLQIQIFYQIFYRFSQMQKIQKTKSLFETFAHQNDSRFSFIFSNNDLNSYRDQYCFNEIYENRQFRFIQRD